MKLFDKIKKSANDFNLNNELVSKAKRGELDGFTDSDREFFIQEHHQTPEKYKEDYDNGQADKEIARALRKHDHMAFVNPALRKDIDGYYYFGSFYKKDTPKYYLVGFKWDGARTKALPPRTQRERTKRKAVWEVCLWELPYWIGPVRLQDHKEAGKPKSTKRL